MNSEENSIKIFFQEGWKDYELLDSGNLEKFERFGKYYLIRPDNQALWKPSRPQTEWQKANAILKKEPNRKGSWKINGQIPEKWTLQFNDLKFWVKLTPFGHLGVFPEQSSHWTWLENKIKQNDQTLNILNLFGYTGLTSLMAAKHGARVCHVDASRPAILWAKENQKLSNLENKPIRWIVDDALKFVKREARRGVKYDGIIMDPPKFGRGPKGEIWQFEDSLVELLEACKEVLSNNPQFFIITAYAVPISSITLSNILSDLVKNHQGNIEYGELALKESVSERILPTSIFARWSNI